jgi:hypothetical protein
LTAHVHVIECLGRGKIKGDNAASYYRFKEDNMRAHPSRRQILDNALASSSRRDLVMRITEAPSGIAARFDFVLNIR